MERLDLDFFYFVWKIVVVLKYIWQNQEEAYPLMIKLNYIL